MSKNESSPSYSSITFGQECKKASNATSFTRGICILIGAMSSFLAIVFAVIAFGQGYGGVFLSSLAIVPVLLVAGASLIAFGTITIEQRKQTALLALQTWETQRINSPDISQYLSRN